MEADVGTICVSVEGEQCYFEMKTIYALHSVIFNSVVKGQLVDSLASEFIVNVSL